MTDPKFTLNRTGEELAEAITKALNLPTEVVTGVEVKDPANQPAAVYSAQVIEGETLELFAVTVTTTTSDIYEAEENTPNVQ